MKLESRSGWHLILDALVGDSSRIADPVRLREFMLRLIRVLDMEILEGPRISEVALNPVRVGTDRDEGGLTGYCLITTSHVSIHTWPLRQRFCLDIFSCRQFDKDSALEEIRTSLGVTQENFVWVERDWPQVLEVG